MECVDRERRTDCGKASWARGDRCSSERGLPRGFMATSTAVVPKGYKGPPTGPAAYAVVVNGVFTLGLSMQPGQHSNLFFGESAQQKAASNLTKIARIPPAPRAI
ncbi:hypothetical protein GJ744_007965 [Endocarpon pusillum]|uniref:Uncharacterized protein n=1 Tax=Endocarpon pusillum TaxID=364733 RepID=A0A8H7AI71_9EURO|nr:hypothetical protein GJ744_007965 [Endocarpon pusillum]